MPGTSFTLCTNNASNHGVLCDLDQGGPVIAKGAAGAKSPNTLVAIINRPRTEPGGGYGERLLYLWPYADWIASVREEYTSSPNLVSTCASLRPTTRSTTEVPRGERFESYYDIDDHVAGLRRTVDSPCEGTSAAAAAAAFSALIAAAVIEAVVFCV